MASILCIETTTKTCSVGLSANGAITALREDHSAAYTHAEQLHVFIDAVMTEAGQKYGDLDAVAVSKGPGSYTGLRIGVSAAKGLAYAKKIPLLSIDPLKALAHQVATEVDPTAMLLPMIDARRMEVYCAAFDTALQPIFPTRAEVLDALSFPEAEAFPKVYYFGDGAAKSVLLFSDRERFQLIDGIHASVRGMAALAERAFASQEYADTAYFEPFYLKDFVAGKPKKSAL